MLTFIRMLFVAGRFMLGAAWLLAQVMVNPSGHWEGAVTAPDMNVKIELDLATNAKGEMAGTFGSPTQQVKGLPFSTVTIDGSGITLELKARSGGTFHGVLSADGTSMSGDFASRDGQYSLPFKVTRTGDARIAPAPKSPAIATALEGTWNGALDAEGKTERLVLKLANQPGGVATGTIVDLDGSGVEIPIGISQKDSSVTIDVPSVGASFTGVLNTAGTEISGAWTQGQAPAGLALVFRRASGT
jgi:hypothetical protein